MSKSVKKSEPTLLNETEAARFLNVSRQTLIRLRKAGQVGHYRIARRVLYRQEHLEEFLASANRNGIALKTAYEGERS
ncbi:MAG TPA: helix-turn-helix domain-containing protein [Pyrinomonadaceae bacterium]|nr:helix-turn-helix domain-containing protein [Pyrinomonadaceae bacterium]